MSHLICIETYGSQRVRAPVSGALVSAYKIGYSTLGRDVLLSLYGSQALDVTPKQTSYHYISISGEVSAHNGFLLFSLTDEELAKVERYTRYHPSSRSGIWRWLDSKWHRFPTSANSEYTIAMGREGPNFAPTRYRAVAPSTGEKTNTTDEIRAEKSMREGQTAWWWITGNTYPHKELLKRWGCRWSKGRGAWYFVGENLPEAVQKLIATPTESPTISPEKLAEAFDKVIDAEEAQAPQHKFALGQTVYAAHMLRLMPNITLHSNHKGQVVKRYQYAKQNYHPHYAYLGEFAYGVLFAGHENAFPVFEENLRDEPEGGRFHSDERFPLIPGMAAKIVVELAMKRRLEIPNERDVLDALQLIKFKEGQTVYYAKQEEQTSKNGSVIRYGDAGKVHMATGTQVLVNFERAGTSMMHEDELSTEQPAPPEEPKPEPIRIIKPQTDDNLQTAIESAKSLVKTVPSTRIASHKVNPIGQKFVGELTGSISGNVYCYGVATYQDMLLYLNLGGPRMSVEAIRARLSKGESVNLVPWDAPAIELSPGETDGKANTGMYSAFVNSISEAKFTSAILVHECITQPNYGGKSLTGIFRTSDEQATSKLLHHVRQLVNIPVFDAWASYLYLAGQSAGLLRKPRSDGDIDLLVLDLDTSAWTRLITGGLANGVIQLAEKSVE